MVTAEVCFALIGSLLFKSAISASINYEPIKITVNENFNGKPGEVSTELQALQSGVLQQGANFYFKPQLNLPQNFIPSHIEALISLIQQHQTSCAKDASKVAIEKDKLIEILQPFMFPLSEISKETLSEKVFEEESLEIVKQLEIISPALEKTVSEPLPVIITEEAKSVTPELLVIPEAPVLPQFSVNNIPAVLENDVKKEESIILEEPTGEISTIPEIAERPFNEPISNYVEPKLMALELANIPEAPVLPSFSLNGIPTNVEEEIKKEETVIVEGQRGVFPAIPETVVRPTQEPIINYVELKPINTEFQVIPEAPVLPPLSVNDIKLIEDGVKIYEPIIVDVESKPKIQEYQVIPDAPLLPLLAIHDIPSIVKEEVKKEEAIIFEEATGEITTVLEIAVRPVTEPIINYVEPKVIASELVTIPEALVLPALTLNGIPTNVEEEIKKEETVIVEGERGVFPAISETAVRPTQEPTINFVEPKPINPEFQVIREAPVLPPLSVNDIKLIEDGVKHNKPIVVDVESKPAIQEYVVIPEAPVLRPLTIHDIPSFMEEEVKKQESIIFEEATGEITTVPEITVRPITEPIINYVEPKVIASEFVTIPEAPVLPPLSFNGIPTNAEEEIKKEGTVIVEGQSVFPTILETAVRPTQEPIINYVEPKPISSEFQVIPEAPVLPPLSVNDIKLIEDGIKINEPIVVDVESKPAIQEYVLIPEAPVLPPVTLHDIPSFVKEEVKKQESIIFEEATGEITTVPEIAMGPITEPIINDVESKVNASEFVTIPEAPVLPPLSFNGIPTNAEEEIKKEGTVIVEGQSVFSTILETAVRPTQEPIINYVEPKPISTEFQVIPEAPVLPPLSVNDIKLIEDGIKINEPIVVDVESKPAIQEYVLIPEAPVLPPVTIHDIPSFVEEEVKKEKSIIFEEATGEITTVPEITVRPITEPIINYVEPKVIASEFVTIPEAPVLPALSFSSIPTNVEEEIKKEETVIVEEQSGVFPTILETAVRPTQEPINNYVEPKPINTEFQVIPEAPVSVNDIKLIEDGVKYNKPIVVDVESKPAIQEYVVIPEAPVLPPLTLYGIPSFMEEEVKKQESIIFEEATGEIPSIPEIAMKPITEPIINYVEPKVIASELVTIPEAPVLPALSFNGIPTNVEEEIKKEETVIVGGQRGVFPTFLETAVRPTQEPIINYVEPKPINTEFQVISEAPLLPPLSANDIKLIEDGAKINEPIVVDVESKPAIQEYVVIPEAPILPPLTLHDIPSFVEEEVKKKGSIIFKEPTGVFSTMPEIAVRPIQKPTINYDASEPTTSDFLVIPEAPGLPPLSANDIRVTEEVKIEEPIIVDVEPRPFISNHIVIPESPLISINRVQAIDEEVKIEKSIKNEEIPEIFARPISEPIISETAESFTLQNNKFPVATEEVKIEIPIRLEETIELFPPVAEISSGLLETIQEPEITNSYVLDEVSQPNPDNVVTIKETLPPTIISKPTNNLGVFSYAPFVSHLSNRAPKMNKLMIAKPASLERFLLKKYPFKLPVTPFPKLSVNDMKAPK